MLNRLFSLFKSRKKDLIIFDNSREILDLISESKVFRSENLFRTTKARLTHLNPTLRKFETYIDQNPLTDFWDSHLKLYGFVAKSKYLDITYSDSTLIGLIRKLVDESIQLSVPKNEPETLRLSGFNYQLQIGTGEIIQILSTSLNLYALYGRDGLDKEFKTYRENPERFDKYELGDVARRFFKL